MTEKANWRLVVKNGEVNACDKDPDRDVDIFLITTVKTMADIWTNNMTYRKAVAADDLSIIGPLALTNDIASWMSNSNFSDLPSAHEI
jgi:hypothetical protein|tara:strand:+ start:92 stop:355 length:264 start_codon:yes stop_codon:yes gene_type:complete